jgi:hypothetical protein
MPWLGVADQSPCSRGPNRKSGRIQENIFYIKSGADFIYKYEFLLQFIKQLTRKKTLQGL